MIPLFKTFIHQDAKNNVLRVLDSGWCGLGPETELFEKEIAQYLGVKYAIAMSSGTEALRIATHIGSRDTREGYAVTTPNTFISTNSVLVQNDMYPVFTDIDYSTGSMKLRDVETALREYSCGLIMVVHYGGYPLDIDAFEDLAHTYSTDIIHDCAHAFGASYQGSRVGYDMKYGCFSFHAVKPLAIGEGGMLVTYDDEVADKARKLRWLGIDKSTYQRSKTGYSWDYDIGDIGYKSHMWDVQAAIGRGQLLHYEEDYMKRTSLVNRYRKNLYSYHSPRPIDPVRFTDKSSNHLLVVLFENKESRQKAMDGLTKEDISYGLHYKPSYYYNHFRDFPRIGTLEMEKFYDTALTLPLHLYMTEADVDKICDIITGD
jgi:perosamine synthetase